MRLIPLFLAGLLVAGETTETAESGENTGAWAGRHVGTTTFGADDNSEVVKMTPDGERAVLVASIETAAQVGLQGSVQPAARGRVAARPHALPERGVRG